MKEALSDFAKVECGNTAQKQDDMADYIERGQELLRALVFASDRLNRAIERFNINPSDSTEVELTRATRFSLECRNRVTDWRNEQ